MDNYIMLPAFVLDRGQNFFKLLDPPAPWNIMQAGILSFYKNLRPLSEIKEAFSKIIGTLLLSYFDEERGSNNFEIFGVLNP